MASLRDQAIEKAQELIASWAARNRSGRAATNEAVVDIMAEDLIEFLIDKFDGEIDPSQLPKIFSSGVNQLDSQALEQVPEPMVPVAIMREVLYTHKVMFSFKNVGNWKTFVARYGRYIMSG